MFKLMFLPRIAVLCSLAMLVSAAFAASASASEELPFRSPSLKSCKLVLSGYIGLYSDAHCEVNAANGAWAWTAPGNSGKDSWFCLLSPSATQLYTEGLCQTHGANGKFLTVLDPNLPFPKLDGKLHPFQVLKSTIAGATAEISCSGGSSLLQPESGANSGEGDITYTGCKVEKPAKCLVGSPGKKGEILTEKIRALQTTATLITFEPQTGANFVELEFSEDNETCALNGQKLAITGTQMCTWAPSIETSALLHDFTCRFTESNLKLGTVEAKYEGLVLATLTDGSAFKIK
jgi:hypothetical protein